MVILIKRSNMVRVSLKDQEGHSAPQRPGGVHLAKRNSRSHFQQVQFGKHVGHIVTIKRVVAIEII